MEFVAHGIEFVAHGFHIPQIKFHVPQIHLYVPQNLWHMSVVPQMVARHQNHLPQKYLLKGFMTLC
jgi:hypothetical protein